MDFKVKSQLLPLLFSGGMAAAQAQTVLQQDTHMFREGDVILKQEVQYKSPGRSGKNVVWDFSELTPLENEYRESYDRMDSLFTCSGMNATYQYRFSGASFASRINYALSFDLFGFYLFFLLRRRKI